MKTLTKLGRITPATIGSYQGKVTNVQGQPLNGFTVNVFDLDTKTQIDTLYFSGSTYDIEPDDNQYYIFQGLNNYGLSDIYSAAQIASGVTVTIPLFLDQPKNNMLLYISAGALGFILLLNKESKKRKKKIGELTTQEVLPFILIGAALIGFGIVQKLLQKLGIWKSPAAETLDALASSSANTNFWSPSFYTQFTTFPAGALTTDQASALLSQLTDAFGIFSANVGQVTAVFRSLTSQSEVSFLAKVFQDQEGMDLLTYIRGGSIIYFGLTDNDVNTINSFLSQLPTH